MYVVDPEISVNYHSLHIVHDSNLKKVRGLFEAIAELNEAHSP